MNLLSFRQLSETLPIENLEQTACPLTIDYTIQMGDILAAVVLILTVIGLIFTAVQLAQAKRINRASLAKELYLRLYDDEDMREIFYAIEWSNYTENNLFKIGKTKDEAKLDKILSFYDMICNLYYRRVFLQKDMELFEYEMQRVFSHPSTQGYLRFLECWQKHHGLGRSYMYLKKYCEKQAKRH